MLSAVTLAGSFAISGVNHHSEGWNIAVLGATGAVGEALLKRWLNVSSRLGKFMHWHVTKRRRTTALWW